MRLENGGEPVASRFFVKGLFAFGPDAAELGFVGVDRRGRPCEVFGQLGDRPRFTAIEMNGGEGSAIAVVGFTARLPEDFGEATIVVCEVGEFAESRGS